ncbi:MAG: putative response regulator, CheY [Pedosphaera sp.]|nr:putative response regulator, CheY [Pedosphaera sp.]
MRKVSLARQRHASNISGVMQSQHILLVEDNAIDAILFQKALRIARPEATVDVVEQVSAAFFYLSGVAPYSERAAHPFPYLVVIDLNLPNVPGMDLIKWIREQPAMDHLLILVLSASDKIHDTLGSYKLGANNFVIKQFKVGDLAESLRDLHETWRARKLYPREPSEETSATF